MSTHNVNFELVAKQNTKTDKNLKSIIKRLDDIKEKSENALGFDPKQIKLIESKLKKINKQQDKIQKTSKMKIEGDKKEIQLLKIKNKMINARQKGLSETYQEYQRIYSKIQETSELNKKSLEEAKNIAKIEKYKNKIAEKKNKIEYDNVVQNKKQKALIKEIRSEVKKLNSSGYDNLNKELEEYTSQLQKGEVLTKTQIKNVKKLGNEYAGVEEQSAKATNKAFGSAANMAAYSQILSEVYNHTKDLVMELTKLDKPVFDLGVVAGKTTAQIEQLKFELLATASTVPQTSEEIAQSLDLIVRTGRDLEESMKIVQAGMQLATSSGEDLHFITETLAKSLVGFGLGADSADEAIDRFYSTVLKTPTSMQGLSNAMKNSTAAFSTLSNLSQKSGKDLEEYNTKLLNLSTAMTGQLALLGNNFVCRVKTSLTAGKYQKVA